MTPNASKKPVYRPVYSLNCQDTTPRLNRTERRAPGLAKRIRRVWYHLVEDVSAFVLFVALLTLCALAWVGLDVFLNHFR